jgi:hypothetical protein
MRPPHADFVARVLARSNRLFHKKSGEVMSSKAPKEKLIGKIALNYGNEIRVELTGYFGRQTVNIRRWFTTREGILMPTRKGIEFSVEHLAAFDVLVRKTHKHAHRSGLFPKKKGE